jgi:hypothetical protein
MRIIKTTIAIIAVLMIGHFSCCSSVDENKAAVSEAPAQQPNEVKKIPALL